MLLCPCMLWCCWCSQHDDRCCFQMCLMCLHLRQGRWPELEARLQMIFPLCRLWRGAIVLRWLGGLFYCGGWRQSQIPVNRRASMQVDHFSRRGSASTYAHCGQLGWWNVDLRGMAEEVVRTKEWLDIIVLSCCNAEWCWWASVTWNQCILSCRLGSSGVRCSRFVHYTRL